ncbi:MAG: ATP-dependent helicase [Thermaceae bacterium]|nr:ATP-dependent helicase [Thermaceae bacterium]
MPTLRLTDEQRLIVAHNEGPALVFAVAGAGKTTALVHRIERLVRERVFDSRKVLATSFSRMATDDFKRLLAAFPHTQSVQVSTLHALGYRIVRKAAGEGLLRLDDTRAKEESADRLLLNQTLRQARALKAPWAEELENLDSEDFLSYVGAAKGNLQYADLEGANLPPEALKVASQARAPRDLEWYLDLYKLLERVRQDSGLLTYDDMLMTGWELLVRHPGLLKTVQSAFQAVLVDEFQDVNLAQSEMLDLITASHHNYMAVGDDDQTIYEWRGASPRFILEFASRYNAQKYLIRDSFRCPAPQVALAGRVIAQNTNREPKRLSLTKGFTGKVHVRLEPHTPAQAESLASDIAGALEEGARPQEIVVLVRLYAQTPYLEQSLIEWQIPYKVVGGTPFYERTEIQTLLSYLHLGREPGNSESRKRMWLQIYNAPKRYLTRALADSVWKGVERDKSLVSVLTEAASKAEERVAKRLRELVEIFEWLPGAIERSTAHAVLESLEARLDFRRHLARSSGFYEVGAGKAESVRAFLDYARDKGSVPELLNHIENLAQEQHAQDSTKERISLMTVFRAKGLEWPYVFIPDCNEGTLPYSGAESLEEERRLFYVALTRSSRHTFLYALSALPLSPFLKEAEHLQTLSAVERVGEALSTSPETLSTAQTLALARGAWKLGLERFLYQWWESENAQPLAAKVLRLFDYAKGKGWLEDLGLTAEARAVWEAFDVGSGAVADGEFGDLEGYILKPVPEKNGRLEVGHKVKHFRFGTGLIIGLEDGVATVAFGDGVRKLAVRHARLERVG